jgi:hypothetical protein
VQRIWRAQGGITNRLRQTDCVQRCSDAAGDGHRRLIAQPVPFNRQDWRTFLWQILGRLGRRGPRHLRAGFGVAAATACESPLLRSRLTALRCGDTDAGSKRQIDAANRNR